MTALLESNPIFLFAVVAALGTILGSARIRGVSVGVAAVLFVGLGLSAWRPRARLPEEFGQLGLVLFVYAIGIASAPGFVSALRARGARDVLFAAAVVSLACAAVGVVGTALLGGPNAAGLFAGALTNTPALAEVVQFLKDHGNAHSTPTEVSAPVVAYSVAYPMGVVGSLIAVQIALRSTPEGSESAKSSPAPICATTVCVTNPEVFDLTFAEIRARIGEDVMFGRIRTSEGDHVVVDELRAVRGALVSVIGTKDAAARVTRFLGEVSSVDLSFDRRVIDFRRIVVSRRELVGIPISALPGFAELGAHITRVRRGDTDFVPSDRTTLEPGDRVRVLAPRARLNAVTRYFGDSIRVFGEVDMLTFGLGAGLGVFVGNLTLPFPGGFSFRLGIAGGPLLSGLLFGALGRTGPLVWSLSGTANRTLREFGLMLFFASVGTRAGADFWRILHTPEGLRLFALGAVVSLSVPLGTVLVAGRVLKLRGPALGGLVAGIQTQPAALAMAGGPEQDERAHVAYATVFPVATVAKILCAQILLRIIR